MVMVIDCGGYYTLMFLMVCKRYYLFMRFFYSHSNHRTKAVEWHIILINSLLYRYSLLKYVYGVTGSLYLLFSFIFLFYLFYIYIFFFINITLFSVVSIEITTSKKMITKSFFMSMSWFHVVIYGMGGISEPDQ